MFFKKKVTAVAGIFLFSFALCAGHLASIGKTETPPLIDGKGTDACWKDCMPMTGMVVPVKLNYANEQTILKFCYDDKNLYGLAICSQKESGKLSQLTPTFDDLNLWKTNSIELFFNTNNTVKHLILNYSGGIYDSLYTQDEKLDWNSNMKWNSAAVLKTSRDNDCWMIEFSIPLKTLDIVPGKDVSFNFVRNNVEGHEGSSWSRLEKYSWFQIEYFSTLKFAVEVSSFEFNGLPTLNPSSEFALDFNSANDVEVKLTVQNTPYVKKAVSGKLLEFKYSVSPKTITVPQSVLLEIMHNGKQAYFFTYNPLDEYIAVSPFNLSNGKLFLGKIINALGIWDSRHNFPGYNDPSGGKTAKDFEIILEVPEGITPLKAVKTGETENNGVKYNIFSQKEKFVYNASGWLNSSFKCSLPPGSKGNIRYYAKWDNGQQSVGTIPFEVIDLKSPPLPKKFITGFYNGYVPDLATAELYKKIGVNTFSLRGNDANAVSRAHELKKAGFFLKREYFWPDNNDTGNQGWNKWVTEDRSARAKDIAGYYISTGKSFQISPSYRGIFFDEAIKKEADFCKLAGINYFAFDMEGYIQPSGDKADFHERTIELFKKYFAEHYPKMAYKDPKEFERAPSEYPQYHTAWSNFKCWLWADFFKEMKERLAAECAAQSSPYPGALFSEWGLSTPWDETIRNKTMRGKEWLDTFDIIEIDNYSSLDRDVRQINHALNQIESSFPGTETKFILTPSPNRLPDPHYKTTAPEVKNEHKYSIMEAAGFGFKGVIIFKRDLMNLDTMRQFADGVSIVCKCEDIVLNGKRVKDISCDQPKDLAVTDNFHGKKTTWENQDRVFIKALEYEGKTLVCVSEYRDLKYMIVTVKYKPGKTVTVIDLETDEIIGKMKADDSSFKVTLEPERRCKLLLLTSEK